MVLMLWQKFVQYDTKFCPTDSTGHMDSMNTRAVELQNAVAQFVMTINSHVMKLHLGNIALD